MGNLLEETRKDLKMANGITLEQSKYIYNFPLSKFNIMVKPAGIGPMHRRFQHAALKCEFGNPTLSVAERHAQMERASAKWVIDGILIVWITPILQGAHLILRAVVLPFTDLEDELNLCPTVTEQRATVEEIVLALVREIVDEELSSDMK